MSTELADLVQLNKSHIRPAAEMLSRAFQDYPWSKYSFADDLERKKELPGYFRYILGYYIRYGEVYATSLDLEGVAVWLASDHSRMTFWRSLLSLPLSVMFRLMDVAGREGGGGTRRSAEHVHAMHRRLAPFKHWYLQTIGVDPQFQGKGYAGKLLRPMLARIDEESLPCYVETVDETKVPLYEHFGFKVVEKSAVPETKLTNWAMLREVQRAPRRLTTR